MKESARIEDRYAPSAPSLPTSTPRKDTSKDDASISSIYYEQQRFSTEQERMLLDIQRITTHQSKIRKKCSKISKVL